MGPLKVFVSSTRLDLVEYRDAVRNALTRRNEVRLLAMEQFGAKPAEAVEVSAAYVREADLLVGIYANRYGYQPEPDGASVTEQEFDAARREHKRRLCYVAGPAAKFPDPSEAGGSEPPEALARLAAFKRRVNELVRDEFDNPHHLAEKVVQDVMDVVSGYPLGFLPREILSNWEAFESAARFTFQDDEPIRSEKAVSSPLEEYWDAFTTGERWADETFRLTDEMVAESAGIPDLAWFSPKVTAIDREASDLVIAGSVRGLVDGRFFAALDALDSSFKAGAAHGGIGFSHSTVFALRKMARRLLDRVSAPRFNRLLLTIGSHGSGKTFFLRTRLAETASDGGDALGSVSRPTLLLPLRQTVADAPLGERLLAAIRTASGFEWRSLREFDRFLSSLDVGRAARLVIVIDDAHKGYSYGRTLPEDLAELKEFVRSPEHPRNAYWVLAANEAFYPALAPADLQAFWHEFSSDDHRPPPREDRDRTEGARVRALSRIGAWISLDALNRQTSVGLDLVEAFAADAGASIEPFFAAEGSGRELLSSPLVALIAARLLPRVPAARLVDLHYIEFVDELWKDRLRAFEGSPFDPASLGRIASFIARVLSGAVDPPSYGDLLEALLAESARSPQSADLNDKADYSAAIDAFEKANLLARREEWSDEEGMTVRREEPRIEIFWASHLARQLTRPSALQSQGGVPGLVRWFEGRRGTELGDGAFSFSLWLLDQARRAGELRELTAAALLNPALPGHAAWLAGSRGSVEYQRLVLETALANRERVKSRLHDQDPQSLFAFMHFVAHGGKAALGAPDERLLLVQPLYDAVARHRLGDYFEFVARWLLAQVETVEVVVNCLDALAGCEPTGRAEAIGRFAYAELQRVAGDRDERVGEAIVTHLRRLRPPEYSAPRRPGHRNYYLWHWLVHLHARAVARRSGLEAFDHFSSWGWFHPVRLGLPQKIGSRVREEPKLALGWWYRAEATKPERAKFVALVEKLLQDPNPGWRETGYFLIRHTVPLDRGHEANADKALDPRAAVVDSEFEFALKLAVRDRSLDSIRQQYPTRVNRPEPSASSPDRA